MYKLTQINGYFCNIFIWILWVFFLCWLSLILTYIYCRVLMCTWPTFLSVTYITCNIQGQPLGIDTKWGPGLTSCFDKSTRNWCSVGSWVVEICAWSTIWNFFDLMRPQRPPPEKVLKFNMSFNDSVKKFFFQNTKIKWY